MIKEAITKIVDLAKPEFKEINGKVFSNKDFVEIKTFEAKPERMIGTTLTGVVDYTELGEQTRENLLIFINSCSTVKVVSKLYGDYKQRDCYLYVEAISSSFVFGRKYELEDFIVSLQAQFVMNENLKSILSLLGNVTDENVSSYADDGMTQKAVAKKGITTSGVVNIPNPVTLRPYRTFPDIEQPESLFILRIYQQEGRPPCCALHLSDGGRWMNTAINSIKEFFKTALPDVPVIG